MDKKKFLNLLKKTLGLKKISEDQALKLDSLNLLQIVELNDRYFEGLSIKNEKIAGCKNVKELIKLYKNKIE